MPVASATVFELRLTYPADKSASGLRGVATRRQWGFLLSGDGLGVTSLAGLGLAERIDARFETDAAPRPVVVLGADPAQDLALVRIQMPRKDPVADKPSTPGGTPVILPAKEAFPNHLELGAPGTLLSSNSWTLVPALGASPAAAVASTELFAGSVAADGGDPASGSVTLNSTAQQMPLGGLPIVNEGARLLGIWAWSWPGSAAPTKSMEIQVLASLVNKYRDEKALSRDERAKRYAQSRRSTTRAFPLLDWPKAGTDASESVRAAKALADALKCSHCKGVGLYTEQPEKRLEGNVWRTIPGKSGTCTECKGSKLVDGGKVWDRMRNLAAKFAAALSDSSQGDQLMSNLENGVGAAAAIEPAIFYKRVNDSAVEELTPANIIPGRSVAFIVRRDEWLAEDAREQSWSPRKVRLLSTQLFGPLLLLEPRSRNVIGEGYAAFVMGTLAGSVLLGDREMVVLERCVVVPIKSDGDKAHR